MVEAIIIGSGIAGPVAAVALARAGVPAVVYEAHAADADPEVGSWLTVAVNGLDALRCLDLHRPVMACGFATEHLRFLSGTGKPLGELPIGGRLADGTVTHTMRRADLYRTLREEALRRGIRFEHGKRLVAAEPTADGRVVARFADGSEARADLLIGADGVHSRVRSIIDPAAPAPRYLGLDNVGGFTPAGLVELAPGTITMTFGARCFFGVTVAPSGEIWWFANPPRKAAIDRRTMQETTTEMWKQQLAARFAGDRTEAAAIVLASTGRIVVGNQYDMPRVPTWHRGPMVIVGDAAHAAAPSSGQGASMAIEDAVQLARCVRDTPDIPAALAAYERLRRARVERVVAHGARSSSTKTVGPIGRRLRDLVLPFFLRRMARPGADSQQWLFEHHIDWDAPIQSSPT